MSRDSEKIEEIQVNIHAETKLAWLISDDDEEDNAKWVPKSQAQVREEGKGKTIKYFLEGPIWLLRNNGWL